MPAPRCDQCCARPRVLWALLESDLDERALELCGHHSREQAEALVAAGWVLVAEEERDQGATGLPPGP